MCEEDEFDFDVGNLVIDELDGEDPGLCAYSGESGLVYPDDNKVGSMRCIALW